MHKRPEFPSNLDMPLGIVTEAGDIKYKTPKTHAEVMAMFHLMLIHMDVIHDHMKAINERAKAAYLKANPDATFDGEPDGSNDPDAGSVQPACDSEAGSTPENLR